jgi:actin-related protein
MSDSDEPPPTAVVAVGAAMCLVGLAGDETPLFAWPTHDTGGVAEGDRQEEKAGVVRFARGVEGLSREIRLAPLLREIALNSRLLGENFAPPGAGLFAEHVARAVRLLEEDGGERVRGILVATGDYLAGPEQRKQQLDACFAASPHIDFAYISPSAVLGLFASGRTTGAVVDVGARESRAVLIYDGQVVWHAVRTIPRGWLDVLDALRDAVADVASSSGDDRGGTASAPPSDELIYEFASQHTLVQARPDEAVNEEHDAVLVCPGPDGGDAAGVVCGDCGLVCRSHTDLEMHRSRTHSVVRRGRWDLETEEYDLDDDGDVELNYSDDSHNGHSFKSRTFHRPSKCVACGKLVRGFTRVKQNGRACKSCGVRVHAECQGAAPRCKKPPSVPDVAEAAATEAISTGKAESDSSASDSSEDGLGDDRDPAPDVDRIRVFLKDAPAAFDGLPASLRFTPWETGLLLGEEDSIQECKNDSALAQLCFEAIQATDVDIRRDFYHNVVLCGRGTDVFSIQDRLESGLHIHAPAAQSLKVIASPDRAYSSWIGGSILASLSSFPRSTISREGFLETNDQTRLARAMLDVDLQPRLNSATKSATKR